MVDIDADDSVTKVVKILVLGNMGTGKTAFVKRFSEGTFSEFYKSTIGADFAYRKIDWDEKTQVGVQLCDISGQDRFYKTSRVFYQDSVAAIITLDMSVPDFDVVEYWKKDIEEKVFTSKGDPIPTLLVGTKFDLLHGGKWEMSAEEIEKYRTEKNYIGFMETSSREGTNIDESIHCIIKYVMDNNIQPAPAGGNDNSRVVDLNAQNTKEEKKKQCC